MLRSHLEAGTVTLVVTELRPSHKPTITVDVVMTTLVAVNVLVRLELAATVVAVMSHHCTENCTKKVIKN